MMNTIVNVRLWGKDVAAVSWNADSGYATIEFYESFARSGWDIAPLVMPLPDLLRGDRVFSFPVHRGKTFKGLPGLLADSLPDDYGNSMIDEWFAAKQMAVNVTPLDRLSYISKRGMGALEYEPATKIPGLNESSRIEMEHLTELAKQVLNQREIFFADLQKSDKTILDLLRVGTSAGGAKPKAIIAFNETTQEVRSGQVKAPEGFMVVEI
jgi:serine/threonine-protein kinase HipA